MQSILKHAEMSFNPNCQKNKIQTVKSKPTISRQFYIFIQKKHVVKQTKRMFKGNGTETNSCSVLPQKKVFGFAPNL